MTGPDQLRDAARRMVADRTIGDRRLELRPGQHLIAEVPAGPGVYLGVIWSTYNQNVPAVLFQRWRYGADGERITVTGLTVVPAECLPAFASAIADAMELAQQQPPSRSG
ncbi:MAG TPA: hypothetical protein VHO67_04745 [Polyangia bacterium]|nr:hypothetical protein [Polyangia bacterium]